MADPDMINDACDCFIENVVEPVVEQIAKPVATAVVNKLYDVVFGE